MPRGERRRIDRVVAAERVDDEHVVGAFGIRDVHAGGQPVHRDCRAARRRRRCVVGRVRAVARSRVSACAVARRSADRAGEIDIDFGHIRAAEIVDDDRRPRRRAR